MVIGNLIDPGLTSSTLFVNRLVFLCCLVRFEHCSTNPEPPIECLPRHRCRKEAVMNALGLGVSTACLNNH